MQPILETARLRLMPVAEEDLEELRARWTDPQVRQFLWDNVVIERNQAAFFQKNAVARISAECGANPVGFAWRA